MFRAHMLIIRSSKLHYTASSIITPIGGRLMHETARCMFNVHPLRKTIFFYFLIIRDFLSTYLSKLRRLCVV